MRDFSSNTNFKNQKVVYDMILEILSLHMKHINRVLNILKNEVHRNEENPETYVLSKHSYHKMMNTLLQTITHQQISLKLVTDSLTKNKG